MHLNDRDDVFITTKLWPTDYGLSNALKAFAGSAQRLRSEFIDLYLLHWPEVRGDAGQRKAVLAETWRAMELLLEAGRCRAVGVSNFNVTDLEEIMSEDNAEVSGIPPHVNQCEFHPYHNPAELRRFCAENQIQFQGYCPLAKGAVLAKAPLREMASKYEITPAQVALKWSLQNGAVTIPKSNNKSRIFENAQALKDRIVISDSDMETLNGLPDSITVIDLNGVKKTIDSDLPDGYKLKRHENVFPKLSISNNNEVTTTP